MTSPRQLAANRANAKKSRGPKSVKGKARSSFNALKHGLTAELIVIGGEDPREFENLLEQLSHDWNPVGPTECVLVKRLAILFWRLDRVPLFEAAILNVHRDEDPNSREARDRDLSRMTAAYTEALKRYRGGATTSDETAEKKIEIAETNRKCGDKTKHKPQPREIGAALLRDAGKDDAIGKVLRYEAALSHNVARTMSMLLSIQNARKAHQELGRPIMIAAPATLVPQTTHR